MLLLVTNNKYENIFQFKKINISQTQPAYWKIKSHQRLELINYEAFALKEFDLNFLNPHKSEMYKRGSTRFEWLGFGSEILLDFDCWEFIWIHSKDRIFLMWNLASKFLLPWLDLDVSELTEVCNGLHILYIICLIWYGSVLNRDLRFPLKNQLVWAIFKIDFALPLRSLNLSFKLNWIMKQKVEKVFLPGC